MTNYQKALKARLVREGRWLEFVKVREGLRAERHEAGDSDVLATLKCWAQAERMFPPMTDDQIAAAADKRVPRGPQPPGTFEGRNSTSVAEVMWVKDHIGVTGVLPEEAPSSGAWGLYQWVIADDANQTKFWTSIYPRIVPRTVSASTGEGSDGPSAADDNTDDLLETIEFCQRMKDGVKGKA